MIDTENPILATDSYKSSHFYQMPPGTSSTFGYLESRGGRYGRTLFFGLQHLLKRYLAQPITGAHIEEAARFMAAHGEPFPEQGWRHILKKHGGRLPVRIRAVPEGTVVPTRNVLLTAESTDPAVPWIVGWIETQIMRLWYPTTVATLSWHCRARIMESLAKSSEDPLSEIDFKLHDFGARGVSSHESAGIGGAAHLVNFKGSDTIEGILFADRYYGAGVCGFSIPAMEHSTVTAWGREGEAAAYRNMIEKSVERGHKMVACVSDSYDIYSAVENIWGDDLREFVKQSGATVVIRPDSGDPCEVNVKILRILDRKLGMRRNGKGFKVLPPYFRLIQGDGNDDQDAIGRVLDAVTEAGFSASNIAFGMGGGLLQKLDRDTQRFAFKLSEIVIDGERRPVRKVPKTDPGKASKAGRLDLVLRGGEFATVTEDAGAASELVTVFEDGKILKEWTFDEIRQNARRWEALR